tara:strand:- start:5140 stop:5643 length:504 start_codon:yes stop_codon:yes gene_type:complete
MTATVDMRGVITFTDLIFTNLSDPTDNGFISVSANLVADWISDGPTNERMIVQANINGGLNEFSDSFTTPGVRNVLTSNATVQLSTPVTFGYIGDFRLRDSVSGAENGSASLGLADFGVFNLPTGYTLNSVDAGIVNNNLAAIPAPGMLTLLAVAFFGMRWRRSRSV